MTQENPSARFDYAALEPLITPHERIIALLLEASQKLADAGEVDAACRIAGKACVALRLSDSRSERRFNVLLHRLTHKIGSI